MALVVSLLKRAGLEKLMLMSGIDSEGSMGYYVIG